MRIWPVAAALVIAPACGRLGFDRSSGDAAGAVDGQFDAPDGAMSSLVHQYSLNNSYVDDLGGPSLVNAGGMFTAGGYQFAINQGLHLLNGTAPDVYTIELAFTFGNVTGYNKVLDFKALGSDAGLYVYDTQLQFVVIPVTGCPGNDCYTSPAGLFTAGTATTIILTRDATGATAGYVDGTQYVMFVDSGGVGAFDSSANVINFFTDDTVTTNEASAGTVRRIRIFSTALTAAQITGGA